MSPRLLRGLISGGGEPISFTVPGGTSGLAQLELDGDQFFFRSPRMVGRGGITVFQITGHDRLSGGTSGGFARNQTHF